MFDGLVTRFTYEKNGVKKEATFRSSHSDNDFKADIQHREDDGWKGLKLSLVPAGELKIIDIRLCFPYTFDPNSRILMNGYQSWTKTCEYFPDEKMTGLRRILSPLKKTHNLDKYGDYAFHKYTGKKGCFHGYTYGYIRLGEQFDLIGSLSEKNGYTVIECDTGDCQICIAKDCEGLCISSPYEVFDLIRAEGNETFVFDTYFREMGIPKPNCEPANGWTSWYNYYQKINEAIILENLEQIQKAETRPGIFQIDDGFQTAVGDWLSIDTEKFPNGMKYLADRIKEKGMKAGLWLAPFVCEKHSRIFREKKDWLLKDSKGRPVAAGFNWSGFYALDLSCGEVREYLRKVFSTVLNEWGYDLVKLDFLYAACLLPNRNKTRGTMMTEAMRFLRDCAGDRLILGCGVPLGPSFGLVDYCRIGCDIGLSWDDTLPMRLLIRERISTRNAAGDTIARRQLDGRAFRNDPDVFLLRNDNLNLSPIQKRTLFTVNYLFGSLLFTSDNMSEYDPVKWELFNMTGRSVRKTITKVEHYRNRLTEVFFEEDGEKRLALINLSRKKLEYIVGPAPGREIRYGCGIDGTQAGGNITVGLKACETRIFEIK